MKYDIYKFIRFALSGGAVAIVDLIMLRLLEHVAGIGYLLSSVLAYIISIIFNFLLQKIWVFSDKDKSVASRQFTYFVILALANLAANTFLMYIFVEHLVWPSIISQAIIIAMLMLINWSLYGKIFKAYTKPV